MRPVEADSQYFKIKMCPFLLRNNCLKGDSCNYAHSAQEIRDGPSLVKTKLCSNFKSYGFCDRGDQCLYAHGDEELRFTADYFKTKICRYYEAGVPCPIGEHCRHAHGNSELRPRSYRLTNREQKLIQDSAELARIFHGRILSYPEARNLSPGLISALSKELSRVTMTCRLVDRICPVCSQKAYDISSITSTPTETPSNSNWHDSLNYDDPPDSSISEIPTPLKAIWESDIDTLLESVSSDRPQD